MDMERMAKKSCSIICFEQIGLGNRSFVSNYCCPCNKGVGGDDAELPGPFRHNGRRKEWENPPGAKPSVKQICRPTINTTTRREQPLPCIVLFVTPF